MSHTNNHRRDNDEEYSDAREIARRREREISDDDEFDFRSTVEQSPTDVLPSKFSDIFRHIDDLSEEEMPTEAVLYIRLSYRTQKPEERIHAYNIDGERELNRRGIKVVAVFYDVAPGWLRDERPGFKAAIAYCEKHNMHMVTHSSDRYVRNRKYHSSNHKEVLPTPLELDSIAKMTANIKIPLTLYHPDLLTKDVERYQEKLGREFSNRKPGRPSKKTKSQIRAQHWHQVASMHENEMTVREIARQIKISESTVRGWITTMEADIAAHGIVLHPNRRRRKPAVN